MAPIGEAYFPPLDRCFSGEHQLLSWRTTYETLSQLRSDSTCEYLRRHLTDPQTVQLLTRPFAPFSAPTPQTKLSFETKTSAINVAPSDKARCDIKQIQDDTLWLSKKTNLDEVSALRIAVLEWQTRPAAELLQGAPGDRSTAVNGASGENQLQVSMFDPGSSSFARSASSKKGVGPAISANTGARQRRLLEIYMSERRYLLKICNTIIFVALCYDKDGTEGHDTVDMRKPSWLQEVGLEILSVWNWDGLSKSSRADPVVDAFNSLRSRLERLREGSGWLQDDDLPEDIELAWLRNQILELIHIMQISLTLIEWSSQLMASSILLSWFKIMRECAFFEDFQPPIPYFRETYSLPMQSLASLISLALLDIPLALNVLAESSSSTANPENDSPYPLSPTTIDEINDVMINAAPLRTPSPAVLAWGIILQNTREIAISNRESRELRQSVRAADKYGIMDTSDADGPDRSSIRGVSSLRRRSSTGSDTSQQSTLIEDIYERVLNTAIDEDPIAYLAKSAIDGGKVFDVITALAIEYCTPFAFELDGRPSQKTRGVLLDLIRACIGPIEYQPALVLTTLAVLTGSERYWDMVDRPVQCSTFEPAASILEDAVFKKSLWLTSLSRFPYETSPFLLLSQALTFSNNGQIGSKPSMWSMLADVDTFACRLPAGFQAYEITRTQEEADFIRLTADLSFAVVPSSSFPNAGSDGLNKSIRALTKSTRISSVHQVPLRTEGELLNNSKPFVVSWHQEYSSLTYMGKILQCASSTPDLSSDMSSATFSLDIIGEIIGLFTFMLSSAAKGNPVEEQPSALDSAEFILGNASDGLDRNQDIISVIFNIFENELYKRRRPSEDLESVDILVQCIHFSFALLPLMPDRVWPFLGRSGLLGIGKDESQLSAITASQEMISGHYDFLLGSIRLFDALIEDVVANAVIRKVPTKAVARFQNVNNLRAGVSQHIMEQVILNFTRTMVEVFESTMNWRFAVPADRMEINYRLCLIFQKVLNYCYNVDENPDISQKLAAALAPAAEYVVDVFLSRSQNNVTILPFLHIFNEGLLTPSTSIPTRGLQFWTSQVRAALYLTTTLIQVNGLLQHQTSHLESEMFKAASMLSKIYVAHESYKLPIVDLIDALICSAASNSQQPPSLLGHLGEETAGHFLEVLSKLDQPLNDDKLSSAIWRLLSSIVSKRQQWFAIFLLTGRTPRETFKDKQQSVASSSRRSEPILNVALENLSNIEKLEPQKALYMLDFVALAADFWPWVLTTVEQHPHVLRVICDYAARIGSTASTPRGKPENATADFQNTQIASHIANILAMYVHHTQQMQNQKFAKFLVPHLTYLVKKAILPPNYNSSLHGHLHQNFEDRFPGCSLSEFKRTTMRRSQFGESYFYDLGFMNKMLAHQSAWLGKKGDGLANEVKNANLNLSFVESEVNLFHSWKSLLIELSGPLAKEEKFQKIMASAVIDCLKANAENNSPAALFERLSQSRADLAFTLLQGLVEIRSVQPEVQDILPIAWETLRLQDRNLESALDSNNANYYRILLKILFLSLQIYVSSIDAAAHAGYATSKANGVSVQSRLPKSTSSTQIALEILTTIVAQGFRSLTVMLHASSSLILPSDFALITAILRSILHVPDLSKNTAHVISAFSDNQTPRCASTLLSWSDQLATNGDPIYGELSILFLLEMSSLPALAETLAVEGVLSHILSTNLIRLLQDRSFGPFDQPARMYSIWSRGILPLLLNLLHAVGSPLAAEIATALNSFPHQLARASTAFASNPHAPSTRDPNAGHITLSMVSEAQTLAIITSVLHTFKEAGASAAVVSSELEEVKCDQAQVKEDIEGWLERRSSLRDRIVPGNEREEAWSREKPVGENSGSENRLEEKVVEEMMSVVGLLGNANGDV